MTPPRPTPQPLPPLELLLRAWDTPHWREVVVSANRDVLVRRVTQAADALDRAELHRSLDELYELARLDALRPLDGNALGGYPNDVRQRSSAHYGAHGQVGKVLVWLRKRIGTIPLSMNEVEAGGPILDLTGYYGPGSACMIALKSQPQEEAQPQPSPKPLVGEPCADLGLTIIAVDFETATPARHSACAIGVVRIRGGRLEGPWSKLIRPETGAKFGYHQQKVHGLTWAMCRKAPRWAEMWVRLGPLLEEADILCAHNAPFDRSVMKAMCEHVGVKPPSAPWVCTLDLAKRHLGLPSAKLSACAEALGFDLNHHEAGSDAMGCARVALALEAKQTGVLKANAGGPIRGTWNVVQAGDMASEGATEAVAARDDGGQMSLLGGAA